MLPENYNNQLGNESPAKLSIQFSSIEYKHWKVGASSAADTRMSQILQYMIQRMFNFTRYRNPENFTP